MEGQIVISGGQLLLILGGAATVIGTLFTWLMKGFEKRITQAESYAEKLATRDRENAAVLSEIAVANNNTARAMEALANGLNRNA